MKDTVEQKKGHIRMLLNQRKIFLGRANDALKEVDKIDKEITKFKPELVERVKKSMEEDKHEQSLFGKR